MTLEVGLGLFGRLMEIRRWKYKFGVYVSACELISHETYLIWVLYRDSSKSGLLVLDHEQGHRTRQVFRKITTVNLSYGLFNCISLTALSFHSPHLFDHTHTPP